MTISEDLYMPDAGATRGASFADVRVDDLMRRGVVTVPPDAPIAEVARVMAHHSIHSVVVREEAAPDTWTIINDLDVLRVAAEGTALTAKDCAAIPTMTLESWRSAREAAKLMSDRRLAHLVVVDDAQRRQPVGLISSLDVIGTVAQAGS